MVKAWSKVLLASSVLRTRMLYEDLAAKSKASAVTSRLPWTVNEALSAEPAPETRV